MLLRRVADGEGFDVPDAALALVARAAKGSFRDAVSMLDQLAAATSKSISVQAVLQPGAAVEEDCCSGSPTRSSTVTWRARSCSSRRLSERGQDLALTKQLLEHLRQLLLVQHVGHVPESLPLTEEARERLREQANQLPEPTVLRLVDLLAVVLEDERQGADPRLPLELALVKVTRPHADLARESLVHRIEVLESRLHAGAPAAESVGPLPRSRARGGPGTSGGPAHR